MRESPVASEKIAVDQASRRPHPRSSTRASIPDGAAGGPLLPSARPPPSGLLFAMPNIKQQEKRVRTAARERLENLRYRSTVKTLTKRLERAAESAGADVTGEIGRAHV